MPSLETEYLRKGLGNICKELRDARKMLEEQEETQRKINLLFFSLSIAALALLAVIAFLLFKIA